MRQPIRLVGSVLVRNEDVFVERAIRNAAGACDRIYAFDHMSDDGTWEILERLAREFDHLEVRRTPRTPDSHRPLEALAGTRTWVLGVDGDELYDPAALRRLREALQGGEHADVFRLKGHVLNCEEIQWETRSAYGYMAPPSRPVTKLFNLAALDSWAGASQRLHDGRPEFRKGFHWESMRYLSESLGWDEDPLRCLHGCFLRRSSRDGEGEPRRNVNESGEWDRSLLGRLKRRLKPHVDPRASPDGANWKRTWYARGERVSIDASPFLYV
jgi:Glycosyl transferase family 2